MDIKAEIEFKRLIKRVAYNDVSIKDLYLTDKKIGDVGAIALADALKTNKSITSLYLSDKHIVDEGIVALVDIESDIARNRKISKVLFNYEG